MDRTGPVNRRDLPVELTDGIASDSIPDRSTFATRGRLVTRPGSPDLDRLRVDKGTGSSGGYPQRKVEIARAHLNQVGPDRVAITDCHEIFLLSVQHLTSKAIQFGVSICQVHSQPPQLIFDMLVFSEVGLVVLGQISQRRGCHLKLLVGLFEKFLYLAAFSVEVWRSPSKF